MKLQKLPDQTMAWVVNGGFIARYVYPYFQDLDRIVRGMTNAVSLPSYQVGTVPSAASNAFAMIYVTNESGGAVPAFSDGTSWRRVTDRAIIS